MGRPREFDQATVIGRSKALFALQGYHATSLDDLVKATGLLRGSIYKAFGSKRNLFETSLLTLRDDFDLSPESLDLLTVALKELAKVDAKISEICWQIVKISGNENISELLGKNLLAKMKGQN
jgi:TetR/AcrR family transcriptional regulator, transcriptional repressor for nem operon